MIAHEGRIILVPLLLLIVAGVILQYFYPSILLRTLNVVLIVLILFSLYFFRDPARTLPEGEGNFISPGDGKIVQIKEVVDPDMGTAKQISIFLSVFNVHSQKVPLDAKVIQSAYIPGEFLAAFNHKASLDNEQTDILFSIADGRLFRVKQIAGLIARRIICYMQPGMEVKRGDRLGFIRFGSRVDIIVPEDFDIRIKVGDRVIGGETIIGGYNEN